MSEGSARWGGGEMLEQFAQRSCGCPISADVQSQIGWSPG